MLKVNDKYTRKTPVHLVLVFLLLTLSRQITGCITFTPLLMFQTELFAKFSEAFQINLKKCQSRNFMLKYRSNRP